MEVHRHDLKTPGGLERMHGWLARADVLVTAQRPSALDRLGLRGEPLHARHPRLCHAQLTGHREPLAEEPGHDLTYLAEWDLLSPPAMPPTLFADMAGAERLVSGVIALAHARDRTGRGARLTVALADAAEWLARPREHGLTHRGALLGGGYAGYNLYASRDGWLALAALEPHFAKRVAAALAVGEITHENLKAAFAREPSSHWTAWSREHDIPLVALPSS